MKGGQDEKGNNCGGSSFGCSSLGAWRPPVAEALIVNKILHKGVKQ